MFKILNESNTEEFIVQIPESVLYQIVNEDYNPESSNKKPFIRFSIGSLLNLNNFVDHFLYSSLPNHSMIFKHTSKNRFDNEVELFAFLPETQKMYVFFFCFCFDFNIQNFSAFVSIGKQI